MAIVATINEDGSITYVEMTLPDLSDVDPPSKAQMLQSIIVTTASGLSFDGNETARNNMMSAIMAADVVGQTEYDWKLADNTVARITLTVLKEALALAIHRVGEIVLNN